MYQKLVATLALAAAAAACEGTTPPPTSTSTLTSATIEARPFHTNVVEAARRNQDYRHVLFTGARAQLALMTLPPGDDIGMESHPRVEQLIFIVSGQGKSIVNGVETPVAAGDVVVATPGSRHDVVNTSSVPLQLYTIYSPPNHIDGRVHATKADAEKDKADEAFGAAVR